MLYTKEQVRDNIRNRQGKRVFYLRKEDCLTAEARDYLREQRIEILSPEEIGKNPYRGENGGIFTEKPEHMTHLNAEILVPKIWREGKDLVFYFGQVKLKSLPGTQVGLQTGSGVDESRLHTGHEGHWVWMKS